MTQLQYLSVHRSRPQPLDCWMQPSVRSRAMRREQRDASPPHRGTCRAWVAPRDQYLLVSLTQSFAALPLWAERAPITLPSCETEARVGADALRRNAVRLQAGASCSVQLDADPLRLFPLLPLRESPR